MSIKSARRQQDRLINVLKTYSALIKISMNVQICSVQKLRPFSENSKLKIAVLFCMQQVWCRETHSNINCRLTLLLLPALILRFDSGNPPE